MRRDARGGAGAVVEAKLEGIRRRLLLRDIVAALGWSILAAAVTLGAGRLIGWGRWPLWGAATAAAAVVAAVSTRRIHSSRAATAAAIERACPDCANVIVTAEELLRHPERAAPWMRDRVTIDATRRLEAVAVDAVVPFGRAAGRTAGFVLLAIAAAVLPARAVRAPAVADTPASASSSDRRVHVRLRLVPPSYAAQPERTLDDVERVEGLEGTRMFVSVSAPGPGWRVRFGARPLAHDVAASEFTTQMNLMESGYLAIEPATSDRGSARLIAVDVVPDRAPSIGIEKPGRDLLLPNGRGAIDITARATDDLALDSLSLRYTKVSGSGEQFEFVEGELPIRITRDSPQSWRAQASIALARLGLEPGDSLVYRMIARDRRAGDAGAASSDTYFVEIAGPGQVPLEGVEMPPDQERYALSQQMIVVKIQRLRERQKQMSAAAVQEESSAIAIEQRSVRANFVFLMGGHVEDEEEEAEQSHEIQEGRLENTARREISIAVSHMSATEQSLMAFDTALGLQRAKLAVEALQRAFGKNRYLLRALPARGRIDPTRRLSGVLDEAGDATRTVAARADDPAAAAARELLSGLLPLARASREARRSTEAQSLLTRSAERALTIGTGREERAEWQRLARQLLGVRAAATDPSKSDVDDLLGQVIASLSIKARGDGPADPSLPPRVDRLKSAWAKEPR